MKQSCLVNRKKSWTKVLISMTPQIEPLNLKLDNLKKRPDEGNIWTVSEEEGDVVFLGSYSNADSRSGEDIQKSRRKEDDIVFLGHYLNADRYSGEDIERCMRENIDVNGNVRQKSVGIDSAGLYDMNYKLPFQDLLENMRKEKARNENETSGDFIDTHR